MTKSDNFFDISGSSTPPKTPVGGMPIEVDFDVFGNEPAPAEAAQATDFTETAVLPNSPRPAAAVDIDLDVDDDSPSPVTPVVPARTAPVTAATDPVPAPGGGMLWIGIAALVVVAVAVWWLMR